MELHILSILSSLCNHNDVTNGMQLIVLILITTTQNNIETTIWRPVLQKTGLYVIFFIKDDYRDRFFNRKPVFISNI